MFWEQLKTSVLTLIVLSVLTGLVYPLAMTGLCQVLFPVQANGSLIVNGGKTVGSDLIGQSFDGTKYFWGRLSATSPYPYNAGSSSGSNFGPSNPALMKAIRDRIDALLKADPGNKLPIPVDLVTASGSGLDPHISPAAAIYQAARVARARGLSEDAVRQIVERHTTGRLFGILGESVVNVLKVNLELDGIRT